MAASVSASNSILSPFPLQTLKKSATIPTLKLNPFRQSRTSAPKMAYSGGYAGRGSAGSFRGSPLSVDYQTASRNGMISVDTCLVLPPPKTEKPRAIIEFLGGAFIGAVSHVTYSYLVELLAKEGFLVVLVPYRVTFNHEDAMREVYQRFNTCLDILLNSGLPDVKLAASQLVDLPVFSVGHSNGALLQLMVASYFSENLPKANAVLSFNNKSAAEAVPNFEQLGPLMSQFMPMLEGTPGYSMASNLSGDALKMLSDAAGTIIPDNIDPELLASMAQFANQFPFVMNEVRQGVTEFRPTPAENRQRFRSSYNVKHTLLVKFSVDPIDETDILEETLKPRVQAIGGTLEKVQLSGNHLTPCAQDPRWQVGDQYTPVDAIAQGLKSASLSDTKTLAQTLSNWFRRLEA